MKTMRMMQLLKLEMNTIRNTASEAEPAATNHEPMNTDGATMDSQQVSEYEENIENGGTRRNAKS